MSDVSADITREVRAETPRLYRSAEHRLLAGVASGLAEHLDLPRKWVRLAFIALTPATGLGIVLYGTFWIVLPFSPRAKPQSGLRVGAEYTLAGVAAIAVVIINAQAAPLGWWFIPLALACLGGALLWRQGSETERQRWRRLSRVSLTGGPSDRLGWLRIVIGVALVFAGGVFLLARAGISAAGVGIAAMVVTLAGVALITGPWWVRLVSELSEERRERIRSEERADIAAQLHDSVLQTLTLIQRNAGSSREVMRLARGQERQLRATLYGANLVGGPFGAALHDLAAEVEDRYAVTIEVVVVGERTVDARLEALLAAAREAMINSAKHSGATSISVYSEIDSTSVAVYVRDRGKGFDPDAIAADRLGVRGSIHARLQRYGGHAQIRSALGEGTEVEMRLPGE